MSLDGSGLCVLATPHVLHQLGRQISGVEGGDGLWDFSPCGLDRNIFVGIKVDASVLPSEDFICFFFVRFRLSKRILLIGIATIPTASSAISSTSVSSIPSTSSSVSSSAVSTRTAIATVSTRATIATRRRTIATTTVSTV